MHRKQVILLKVVHENDQWIGMGYHIRVTLDGRLIHQSEVYMASTNAIAATRKWCSQHYPGRELALA